jgi:hypothetical protein
MKCKQLSLQSVHTVTKILLVVRQRLLQLLLQLQHQLMRIITLTAKPGVNFNAYAASGTVAETVPYVAAVLDAEYMCRLFPIRHGSFGSKPNLPIAGDSYCEYHFTIRGLEEVQDVDGANHWNNYEKEVYFYVRSLDPNFAAFDGPVADLIPIANGGTL